MELTRSVFKTNSLEDLWHVMVSRELDILNSLSSGIRRVQNLDSFIDDLGVFKDDHVKRLALSERIEAINSRINESLEKYFPKGWVDGEGNKVYGGAKDSASPRILDISTYELAFILQKLDNGLRWFMNLIQTRAFSPADIERVVADLVEGMASSVAAAGSAQLLEPDRLAISNSLVSSTVQLQDSVLSLVTTVQLILEKLRGLNLSPDEVQIAFSHYVIPALDAAKSDSVAQLRLSKLKHLLDSFLDLSTFVPWVRDYRHVEGTFFNLIDPSNEVDPNSEDIKLMLEAITGIVEVFCETRDSFLNDMASSSDMSADQVYELRSWYNRTSAEMGISLDSHITYLFFAIQAHYAPAYISGWYDLHYMIALSKGLYLNSENSEIYVSDTGLMALVKTFKKVNKSVNQRVFDAMSNLRYLINETDYRIFETAFACFSGLAYPLFKMDFEPIKAT